MQFLLKNAKAMVPSSYAASVAQFQGMKWKKSSV